MKLRVNNLGIYEFTPRKFGYKFLSAYLNGTSIILKILDCVLKVLKFLERIFFRFFFSHFIPIVPKRILFCSFQNTYTCNLKSIAEEAHTLLPNYELIFVVDESTCNGKECFPDYIHLVQKETLEYCLMHASAQILVDNALCCMFSWIPIKKTQLYINTWHGSLGIKRLSGNLLWRYKARKADKKIDFFVTNSIFEEKVFSHSFFPHARFFKVGHPRNDVFFNEDKRKKISQMVRKNYGIDSDTHIALYAPTFRDNVKDTSAIEMNFELIRTAFEKKFGGKWIIFVRFHYKNKSALRNNEGVDYIKDVTDYPDMQDLLLTADAGLTDYSSWIFDYIYRNKPAFLYARDISNYQNSRGFYYPLSETPFSISETDEELAVNIMSFDSATYERKCSDFLISKGAYEYGCASEKVCRIIDLFGTGMPKNKLLKIMDEMSDERKSYLD